MRRFRLTASLLLLLALVATACPGGAIPVSAAEGRYVLTETIDVAADGYAYADREAMIREYYGNYLAQGLYFDYSVKNEDGLFTTYVDHQMDGNLYPPHERIKATFASGYSRPAFLVPGQEATMTISLDYLLELTTTRATAAGSHGTMTVALYGGETTATMTPLGGQTVTLADQAKLSGTLSFKVGNTHRHILMTVISSNFAAGGLGKGYHYELKSQPSQVSAAPSRASVLVNGAKVAFDAYNISNSNYFKLRDIAKAITGSARQFNVGWDGTRNAITLTPGTPYVSIGGELTATTAAGSKTATLTTSRVLLNALDQALTAYNIGGSNYFKLRDIGRALNFSVVWNAGAGQIEIDTGKPYQE